MEIKYDRMPMAGELSDFQGPAMLIRVDETKWEKLRKDMVSKHHYLGYEAMIGSRVKYIIALAGKVVGAISFCSATFKLGLRDKFVGWEAETRLSMLPRLVNDNRFLILPWVRIRNLASHVLAMSLKQLRVDWKKKYGVEPYMAETFVDSERFAGTCHIAANWIHLGTTKGFGRQGNTFVYHGRTKDIFVKIMSRRFASAFKPDVSRLPKSDVEAFMGIIVGASGRHEENPSDMGAGDFTLEKLGVALADHLKPFLQHLNRIELRAHIVAMVKGLLGPLPRKSIEPIAINYAGRSQFRSLVYFMGKSKWDDQGMLETYQNELAKEFSDLGGMLCVDGCDFRKAGKMLVGFYRQPCGDSGHVENCQAAMFMSYVSQRGWGLFDYALHMSEAWLEDSFADKREKCDVPEGLQFKTKNQMALEMLHKAAASGRLQYEWVGFDSAFGQDGDFRKGLPEGVKYFADVPFDQPVFLKGPKKIAPERGARGRKPSQDPRAKPVTVQEAIEIDDAPWSDVVLGVGAKGLFITRDKRLAGVESRQGLPGEDAWLYARLVGGGDVKYSLCNAPMDAPIEAVRAPARMRWSIEQAFKDCKQHLGMGNYELRSWTGWRRHMLLVLICHFFVTKLRLRFGHEMASFMSALNVDGSEDSQAHLDAA